MAKSNHFDKSDPLLQISMRRMESRTATHHKNRETLALRSRNILVGSTAPGNGAGLWDWACMSGSVDRHQAFGEAPAIGGILQGAVAQVPGRRFI